MSNFFSSLSAGADIPTMAPIDINQPTINLSGTYNEVAPFGGSFNTPAMPTLDTGFLFNAPSISPNIATPSISASSFATPAINTSLSPSLSFGASSFAATPSQDFGMDFMSSFQSAPGVAVPESREPTGRFTREFENQILKEVGFTPMEMLFAQPAAPAGQFTVSDVGVRPSGQVGASLFGAPTEGTPTSFVGGMSAVGNAPALPPAQSSLRSLAEFPEGGQTRDLVTLAGAGAATLPLVAAGGLTAPALAGAGGALAAPFVAGGAPATAGGITVKGALGTLVGLGGTGLTVAGLGYGVSSFRESRARSEMEEAQNEIKLNTLIERGRELENFMGTPEFQFLNRTQQTTIEDGVKAAKALDNPDLSPRAKELLVSETSLDPAFVAMGEVEQTKPFRLPEEARELFKTTNERTFATEVFKDNKVRVGEETVSVYDKKFLASAGIETVAVGTRNIPTEEPDVIRSKVEGALLGNPAYEDLEPDQISSLAGSIVGNLTKFSYRPGQQTVREATAELTESSFAEVKRQIPNLSPEDQRKYDPQLKNIEARRDNLEKIKNPTVRQKEAEQIQNDISALRSEVVGAGAAPVLTLNEGTQTATAAILTDFKASYEGSEAWDEYIKGPVSQLEKRYQADLDEIQGLIDNPVEGVDQATIFEMQRAARTRLEDGLDNLVAGLGQVRFGALNNRRINPRTGGFERDLGTDIALWGGISGFVAPFLTLWMTREEREEQRSFERSMMYEKAGLEQRYWMERYRPAGGGGGGGGTPQAPMSGRTDIPLVPLP